MTSSAYPVYTSEGAGAASASANNLTPALPASVPERALLMAVVGVKNGEDHASATAGWTQILQTKNGTSLTTSYWAYKPTAYGTDGFETAPQITWASAAACFAKVFMFTGQLGFFQIGYGGAFGTGPTHSCPGYETSFDWSRVVYVDCAAANTALATPDGWEENSDTGSVTANMRITVGGKNVLRTDTDAGDVTVTGANAAWTFAFFEIMSDDGNRILDDNVPVQAQFKAYAELAPGTWTDVTSRVLQSGVPNWGGGIRGTRRTDVMASSAPLNWVFKNPSGEFYPQGPAPLLGWKKGVKIRIAMDYDGREWVQWYGRVINVKYDVNVAEAADTVSVTVGDWFDQAQEQPFETPESETDMRVDQAVVRLISQYCTIPPLNFSLDTGDTVFEAVFDTAREQTTAYAELGKLARSEIGPIYLTRDAVDGETLRVENRTRRDTAGVPKKLPVKSADAGFLKGMNGDYLLFMDGGKIRQNVSYRLNTMSGGYTTVNLADGANHSNSVKFITKPRRVDENFVRVGSTGEAMPISAGQTINFRINYSDPSGGNRISAVTTSIQEPRKGLTQNPNIKSLLHFTSGVTDSTGYRTWTPNDVTTEEQNFVDGFGTMYISGTSPAGGPFAIFGGYANYYITAPNSADFNFAQGDDFTIGCYVAVIDVSATGNGKAILSRNSASSFPPWLFGLYDYANRELKFYASTNGSSWNYANGLSMGPIAGSRWTWLEWGRRKGWNRLFSNGKKTAEWYNDSAFPATGTPLSVGLTQVSNYMYMGLDELIIVKGECLHAAEFDPPRVEYSIYYDEDYWANTAKGRDGTDITNDMVITLTDIGTDSTSGTIQNTGASDGFVFLGLRGLGIYRYQDLPYTARNEADIAVNGIVNPITVDQPYQVDTVAAKAVADAMVANEGTATTDLIKIGFNANKSHYWMVAGLLCDVGDVVPITFDRAGISGYWYIQAVDKEVWPGNMLWVTWTLRKDFGT